MRDRGTILAGTGIAIAFLVAGVFFLMFQAQERAEDAAVQARVEAEHFRAIQGPEQPLSVDFSILDEAIHSGSNYLLDKQSPDGAWRSDTYATFKDGTALTPLVLCAIQKFDVYLPAMRAMGRDPVRMGCDFLAKLIKPDGTAVGGEGALEYPAYTAALSVMALTTECRRDPEGTKDLLKARDAWLKYLLDRQLTEKLGWKPEDKQYGGWGYCRLIPKKPEPNAVAPPLIESNLSATVFALEALKAAGVKDKQVYEKSLVFVRRCQNYSGNSGYFPPQDDGGFFFIYDDPVRNKAGRFDLPGEKETRFHSYGSTTADGVRAFCICGEDLRVFEAQGWLIRNFKPDTHPGKYIEAHERNREAVYYYYAASVSKALRAAKVTEAGGTPWAEALATELAKRQKPDGSWANSVELVRENEPLVATAHAVIALANCKAALIGK